MASLPPRRRLGCAKLCDQVEGCQENSVRKLLIVLRLFDRSGKRGDAKIATSYVTWRAQTGFTLRFSKMKRSVCAPQGAFLIRHDDGCTSRASGFKDTTHSAAVDR